MQIGEETLRVQLLGAFRVRRGETPLMLPAGAARLLAALALSDVVERREVAGMLWPESTRARANADLRTALWRLQRTERGLVVSTRHLLSLAPAIEVDLRHVERWALAAIGPDAHIDHRYEAAPVTTIRTLLPGMDEPWLDQPRERLRQLQVQAFEAIAQRILAAGRVGEAMPYILQVTQSDPLRESANQLLMEAHLRQGNVAEALTQFRRYQEHLRELGVAPGLGVTTLVARYLPAQGLRPPMPRTEPEQRMKSAERR